MLNYSEPLNEVDTYIIMCARNMNDRYEPKDK